MADLTFGEQRTVGECLRAAADGPFIPDGEFETLFGVTRVEVRSIADQWPAVDASSKIVAMSVNNSMLHLLYYPHRQWDAWEEYSTASPDEVERVYKKWRGVRLAGTAGRRMFDGLM